MALAIIPDNEVAGGLSYNGTTWDRVAGFGYSGVSGAGAAPKNAHWFWKVNLSRGEATWSYENGGRMVVPVSFTCWFEGARPEAHKLFTVGDPVAQGITTLRL
jgi:hypothetical protein